MTASNATTLGTGMPAQASLHRRRFMAQLLGGCAGSLPIGAWPAISGPGRKLALVIGNGDYKRGALKNPVNDAQSVADNLRQLGFEVQFHRDLDMARMIEAMRAFSIKAPAAEVRLVYFAGHGIQLKGRNYLLPIDADVREEQDVASRGADIGELVDRLARIQQGLNVVILDACRNNPFSGGEIVGPDGRRIRLRGVGGVGLAPLDAPAGTVVAFATAPGGIAFDNPREDHSLYTKHLIARMQTPGLPIELLLKQVRLGVVSDTQRQQVPWESSSLTGDFCFKPNAQGACIPDR